MSMNEIYETLQGISLSDISAVLSRLDESGHALTQAEIRQEVSTANEVERARAVMRDLDGDSTTAREDRDSVAASDTVSENGLETISLDDIEDIDDPDEELDDL